MILVIPIVALPLHPGGGLSEIVIALAAHWVGWCFVRRRKRLFSSNEMRELIAECFLYLILFEFFTLWANAESLPILPPAWRVGTVAIAFGLDLIVLWLAFRYPVRKMMQKRLDRIATSSSLSG